MGLIIGKGISVHRQGRHGDHCDTEENRCTGKDAASADFIHFTACSSCASTADSANLANRAALAALAVLVVLAVLVIWAEGM